MMEKKQLNKRKVVSFAALILGLSYLGTLAFGPGSVRRQLAEQAYQCYCNLRDPCSYKASPSFKSEEICGRKELYWLIEYPEREKVIFPGLIIAEWRSVTSISEDVLRICPGQSHLGKKKALIFWFLIGQVELYEFNLGFQKVGCVD